MTTPLFTPAPEPPTELGRYRPMAATAGIKVSPLQLGAMSVGEAWSETLGSMDKEKSFKLLDAYFEAGGNYIDTANNYQNEESETWVGEWMKARQNRDNMVIATKYTAPYKLHVHPKLQSVNHAGNHKRSLHMSVRDSLRKLQTDWIDILYLHFWDHTTSVEEVMDALHILVEQGKVLYLGISDTPAYLVAAANTYAKAHGKTPFSIYQGRWNVMDRGIERDVIPMCRYFVKKQIEERQKSGEGVRALKGGGQSEKAAKMSEALEKVAHEHGIESLTAIALAWIIAKAPRVYPIIGGRKVEHLKDNIQALKIKLTDKQMEYLESQTPFEVDFPQDFVGDDPAYTDGKISGLVGNAAPQITHIKEKSILRQ